MERARGHSGGRGQVCTDLKLQTKYKYGIIATPKLDSHKFVVQVTIDNFSNAGAWKLASYIRTIFTLLQLCSNYFSALLRNIAQTIYCHIDMTCLEWPALLVK